MADKSWADTVTFDSGRNLRWVKCDEKWRSDAIVNRSAERFRAIEAERIEMWWGWLTFDERRLVVDLARRLDGTPREERRRLQHRFQTALNTGRLALHWAAPRLRRWIVRARREMILPAPEEVPPPVGILQRCPWMGPGQRRQPQRLPFAHVTVLVRFHFGAFQHPLWDAGRSEQIQRFRLEIGEKTSSGQTRLQQGSFVFLVWIH